MSLAVLVAVGTPPDPVTRAAAQAAARAELSKRAYHRNDPSLIDRGLVWLLKKLGKLLENGARHAPGHQIGLLLILLIVAALVAVVVARVGVLRRSPHADEAIFGVEQTTADDHRRRADEFAKTGEWAEAIRERLRAIARELEQRGHRFVRYADDCNIYVRSERSGQRVMAGIAPSSSAACGSR